LTCRVRLRGRALTPALLPARWVREKRSAARGGRGAAGRRRAAPWVPAAGAAAARADPHAFLLDPAPAAGLTAGGCAACIALGRVCARLYLGLRWHAVHTTCRRRPCRASTVCSLAASAGAARTRCLAQRSAAQGSMRGLCVDCAELAEKPSTSPRERPAVRRNAGRGCSAKRLTLSGARTQGHRGR